MQLKADGAFLDSIRFRIAPACTFTPAANPGSARAASSPPSASFNTYGKVAFVNARVDVLGYAPGMLVTQ